MPLARVPERCPDHRSSSARVTSLTDDCAFIRPQFRHSGGILSCRAQRCGPLGLAHTPVIPDAVLRSSAVPLMLKLALVKRCVWLILVSACWALG